MRDPSRSRWPGCTSAIQVSGSAGGPDQETLGGAAAGQPRPDQPRRKHARVVDDEQIAGAKQRGKIGEVEMRDAAAGAIDRHEPAGAARRRRLLRDQLSGQIEIEIGNVHKKVWPGSLGRDPGLNV